jgi:hypothetical protein
MKGGKVERAYVRKSPGLICPRRHRETLKFGPRGALSFGKPARQARIRVTGMAAQDPLRQGRDGGGFFFQDC